MKGTHLTICLLAIVIFFAVLSFPLGTWIFAALIGLVPANQIFDDQESQDNYTVKWWLKFCGIIAAICVVLLIAFGVDILPYSVASPLVVVLIYVVIFTLLGVGLGYIGRVLRNWIRSKHSK